MLLWKLLQTNFDIFSQIICQKKYQDKALIKNTFMADFSTNGSVGNIYFLDYNDVGIVID